MRASILLLFVALTLSAQAQVTVDPNELTYGPFGPGPADRSFAIGVAGHGMLLAWSEIDPQSDFAVIHTGLLDLDARLAGSIHRLAPLDPHRHATSPAIATDGTNFLVTWLERDRYSYGAREVAGALLDREGTLLAGPFLLGVPVPGYPSMMWNGIEYRVYGSNEYAISTRGEIRVLDFAEVTRRVPFANSDAFGWIEWRNEPRRSNCIWFCRWPPTYTPAVYNLDWAIVTREWIRTGSIRETGYNAGTPTVTADGSEILAVWSTPHGLTAARVIDGRDVERFADGDDRGSEVTPRMAGSLVVFDRYGVIYGTTIEGNEFGPLFPIAEGDVLLSDAGVYAVGNGRYLVTYVRPAEGGTMSLAGRFVIVTPGLAHAP